MRRLKIFKISVLLTLILFLSGCTITEKLSQWGRSLEERAWGFFKNSQEEAWRVLDEELGLEKLETLTDLDRAVIDEWVREQGLNYYGEALDTIYKEGSPLFDEVTGAALDRYNYILENHPELQKKLGL